MHLTEIVPWGRSFDEYRNTFALSDRNLAGSILGCGDGPAAFNAVLTRRGGSAVSVDPLYAYSELDIRRRIAETADVIMRGVNEHHNRYCWTAIPSPEILLRTRLEAMATFLKDYGDGRRALRYIPAALPHLPFGGGHFDLALCSHLLFTYSEHLDLAFHLAAVRAMLRCAGEARIFPLLTLDGEPSPHLEPMREALAGEGYAAHVEAVPYEFQKGGNQMLRVVRSPTARSGR